MKNLNKTEFIIIRIHLYYKIEKLNVQIIDKRIRNTNRNKQKIPDLFSFTI